jgi:hypothetical protein
MKNESSPVGNLITEVSPSVHLTEKSMLLEAGGAFLSDLITPSLGVDVKW